MITLDKALAQAILNYLFRQPYGDVFQLIAPLAQALRPVPPGQATVPPAKAKSDKSAALKSAEAKLKKQLEEVTE